MKQKQLLSKETKITMLLITYICIIAFAVMFFFSECVMKINNDWIEAMIVIATLIACAFSVVILNNWLEIWLEDDD